MTPQGDDRPARTFRFDVLTLFPEIFQGYLGQSLLKLALQQGLVEIHLWNLRDWATGKHKSVDDRPFGGGPGMVILPGPVFDAVEAVRPQAADPGELILLTPAGRRLDQALVQELAQQKRLLLLCGRYEGFDERIRLGLRPREVSIGDFVCNGGEVPAMVVIDTVIRYVPGVLGDPDSVTEESHSQEGRLEYPQYTRPRVFRGMEVPEILLSGNHQAVARWRREQSEARSREQEEQTRQRSTFTKPTEAVSPTETENPEPTPADTRRSGMETTPRMEGQNDEEQTDQPCRGDVAQTGGPEVRDR